MNIIVFGARGDVGSRIVSEALDRNHKVTGVVRNEKQIGYLPSSVTPCVTDIQDTADIAPIIAGHDIAISAVRPPDGQEDALVFLTASLMDAAKLARVPLLLVGGAASLKTPDDSGHTILTAPGFLPDTVIPIAKACQAQYELCLKETVAKWTYVAPPAMLLPGTRTGQYLMGSDVLLVDHEGNSQISMEDFAVALIDEAERPQHPRMRFTVANRYSE